MGDVKAWPRLVSSTQFPKQEKCRPDPATMSGENKSGDDGECVDFVANFLYAVERKALWWARGNGGDPKNPTKSVDISKADTLSLCLSNKKQKKKLSVTKNNLENRS